MLALWSAATKIEVLFGCCILGLFFAVGFLFTMLLNERKERRIADSKLNKARKQLGKKYHLLNTFSIRLHDKLVDMGGRGFIKQHRDGDVEMTAELFENKKCE